MKRFCAAESTPGIPRYRLPISQVSTLAYRGRARRQLSSHHETTKSAEAYRRRGIDRHEFMWCWCGQTTIGEWLCFVWNRAYLRQHVTLDVTPPRLSLMITQKCTVTPRAGFVCFVGYTATSAYSVLNVRENIWRQQVSPCRTWCTHLYKKMYSEACVMSPEASYPATVSLHPHIQTYLTTPHDEIDNLPLTHPFSRSRSLAPHLPTTIPFHPPSAMLYRSYSAVHDHLQPTRPTRAPSGMVMPSSFPLRQA